MSTCCCPEPRDTTTDAPRCPVTGATGTAVDRQTVKALLTETALTRLTTTDYRFCPDAGCDIVYFGADGSAFGTVDVRVDVWQKLPFGSRQICYCFGESEASIRDELEATGQSSASARIREHIAAQRCACDVRNPRGACCLGDVMAAIARVESAMPGAATDLTRAETAEGR
jgi:hypothetical protein